MFAVYPDTITTLSSSSGTPFIAS